MWVVGYYVGQGRFGEKKIRLGVIDHFTYWNNSYGNRAQLYNHVLIGDGIHSLKFEPPCST